MASTVSAQGNTFSECCQSCRFNEAFTRDEGGMPRSWTLRVDIAAITQAARCEAARSLALLALFRLHAPPAAVEAVQTAILSLPTERQVRLCQGSGIQGFADSLPRATLYPPTPVNASKS